MRRMTAKELDETVARLEEIGLEEEELRAKLRGQVESFGSILARAERSRRLAGEKYQFTVTHV